MHKRQEVLRRMKANSIQFEKLFNSKMIKMVQIKVVLECVPLI